MRPIRHDDVTDAARHLLTWPASDWPERLRRLLRFADLADRYRKRHRRCHPMWGDGSLGGAARQFPLPAEPGLQQASYQRAMHAVLSALLTRA